MMPPFDPDPLYVGPSADYVEGYDAGFEDAERLRPSRELLQATAFGLGIVIGMILATALIFAAASRPGPNPTAHDPGEPGAAGLVRASAPALVNASGPGQSGAPQASHSCGTPSSPAVAHVATSEGPSGPTAPMPATPS